LLKAFDRDEMSSLIDKENKRQAQIREEKEREEKAKKNLVEAVSSWDTLVGGLHFSYLFYYYPTTCDFEATEEEWSNRWIVWDFKNTPGKTSASDHKEALDKAIPMLKKKLLTTFEADSLKYLTLVCIPASSQIKTQARYEEFSNRISGELGLINAYPHISVVTEKEERRSGGTSIDTNKLSFDEDFFKGKYVLLFDDVITRGDSMRTFKRKMESLGAIVVGGLSLGKTKHERPIQGNIPNPFSRPVFPHLPPSTSDDDDLPF
jgi:predicted amidophosphoribosyltransferase